VTITLAAVLTTVIGAPVPAKFEGGMLVGFAGMTPNALDKDAAGSGMSTCIGQCGQNRPPLQAADADHAPDAGRSLSATPVPSSGSISASVSASGPRFRTLVTRPAMAPTSSGMTSRNEPGVDMVR